MKTSYGMHYHLGNGTERHAHKCGTTWHVYESRYELVTNTGDMRGIPGYAIDGGKWVSTPDRPTCIYSGDYHGMIKALES